ncbi:MAG: hypothetical protein ABSA75_09750 [Candidatus Bathyarchaeia archaeon]
MLKVTKNHKVFALILLASFLLLSMVNPNITTVKAQGNASVSVIAAVGGTSSPAGGTTTSYPDGTVVTLTATAGSGFSFFEWEIVTSLGGTNDLNNPTTLTVNATIGTYVIQPLFIAIQNTEPNAPVTTATLATAAIVVVLAGAGGTTTPPQGTYALASATALNLTATADSGWVFDHWVISGTPVNHGSYSYTATPTDNPYNVNHGYGNTYTYQPVFSPTSPTVTNAPTATPKSSMSSSDTIIIVALVVIIVIVIIGFVAYASMQRSKKQNTAPSTSK